MKSHCIHYYNPNLHLKDLIKCLWISEENQKLEEFFKTYSGKKYILLTFSGRSALYLAYRAIEKRGKVITSPLTCLTALLPILYAGNEIIFTDINKDNLTLEPQLLAELLPDEAIAVQAIHFGGIPCDMKKIRDFTKSNGLYLVEDCAQGFGATVNGENVGSFGDISVYSLAKNLYGITGGVLATNDLNLFEKAKIIQSTFSKSSVIFLFYRIIRNVLKSQKGNIYWKLYHKLMNIKRDVKGGNEGKIEADLNSLINYLHKPSRISMKISANQLPRLAALHELRKETALQILHKLKNMNEILFPQINEELQSSFVKLYLRINKLNENTIKKINEDGIEAKHLEEEFNVFYQKRLDKHELFKDNASLKRCTNYLQVHDLLISLPLHEYLSPEEIQYICDRLLFHLNV